MSVQAVIFDMDGTLVDSMPFHMESWRLFFANHKISLTKTEFDAIHHGTVFDIMPRLFGSHISSQEAWTLGNEKESLYRELYRGKVVPTKGLPGLLQSLYENNIPMAIGTAADDLNAAFVMDELDIHHFFKAVVTSNQVPEGKPSPKVYLETAKALAVNPAQCIVFEDTISGIEAAKAAGMTVVGITTGLDASVLLQHGAAMAIDNFTQIDLQQIERFFV